MATLGYHVIAGRYPGKTEAQIARIIAWRDGYRIVARYKLGSDKVTKGITIWQRLVSGIARYKLGSDKEYSHFALCRDEAEFRRYQETPNCQDLEILCDTTKEAPKGLYCRQCNRYLPAERCIDVHYMVAEDAVSFDCPDCRTSRVYVPRRDAGL